MTSKSLRPRTSQKVKPTKEEEYQVEEILNHKFEHNTLFYFVKWKNYSEEESTWEPDSNLSKCPLIVQTYLKKFLPLTDAEGKELVEPTDENLVEVKKSLEVKKISKPDQLSSQRDGKKQSKMGQRKSVKSEQKLQHNDVEIKQLRNRKQTEVTKKKEESKKKDEPKKSKVPKKQEEKENEDQNDQIEVQFEESKPQDPQLNQEKNDEMVQVLVTYVEQQGKSSINLVDNLSREAVERLVEEFKENPELAALEKLSLQ